MEKQVKETLLEQAQEFDVVPREFVDSFADEFDLSVQAVLGVLRANQIAYEKVEKQTKSAYSADQVETIVKMVNDGAFIEEIAEAVGKEVKSVRGKCLALLKNGLIDSIPTVKEKKETKRPSKYTAEEDAKIVAMVNKGESIEAIADAMGKNVKSIRGKCLALLKKGQIETMPKSVKKPKVKEKKWTDEKVENLKNVYLKNNKDLEKTAQEVGESVASCRYALSRLTDVYESTAKPKTKFWTDEKVADLKALYKRFGGDKVDKIASNLKTTNLVVYKKLKELGLEYTPVKV